MNSPERASWAGAAGPDADKTTPERASWAGAAGPDADKGTDSFPAPPIAAETDLRHLPWMALKVPRLLDSDFLLKASHAEIGAALLLWAESWRRVPAGSLPAEDTMLCKLAGFGTDRRGWCKVRAMALYGWAEHSDGLLYHPVVTETVQEAVAFIADGEAARAAKVRGGKARAAQRAQNKPSSAGSSAGQNDAETPAVLEHNKRQGTTDTSTAKAALTRAGACGGGLLGLKPSTAATDAQVAPGVSQGFERFWAVWPAKKRDKSECLGLFMAGAAQLGDGGCDRIVKAAERYAAEMRREAVTEKFIQHPKAWLGREGWTDYDAPDAPAPDDPVHQWRGALVAYRETKFWSDKHDTPPPDDRASKAHAAWLIFVKEGEDVETVD